MDASEYYDFEDRRYVSPTVSRDEQLAFADNLRDVMGKNAAQINASTQALGTNIPSSMGGLTGSGSYFAQRYQTTPVESAVNTLRATAQAKALNDLMGNYEKQMANRAQQAYRRAKRRASTTPDITPDTTTENPLQITTNGGGQGDDTYDVDTTDWQTQINKINTEPSGKAYYLSYQPPYRDPVRTYVSNLTSGDDLLGTVRKLGAGSNGEVRTLNGVRYIYLDTGQFAPSWYRVDAQFPSSVYGGQ